ncbi:hypothetical protein ACVWXM_006149 [Bradyrhizobium sp. GM7.3]
MNFLGVNDRGGLHRADALGDDDAVAEPAERGRCIPARVAIGGNEAAISGHRAIAPIACDLFRQLRMDRKAPSRQRIERRALAPVAREEAARLA